ncbi:MAG: ssDNA endodeoxyribonuclease [Chaenotheca gracillima]|nr:MAG: ssDNA endodeoxyribonuclease [Chaenotheca gracillima]
MTVSSTHIIRDLEWPPANMGQPNPRSRRPKLSLEINVARSQWDSTRSNIEATSHMRTQSVTSDYTLRNVYESSVSKRQVPSPGRASRKRRRCRLPSSPRPPYQQPAGLRSILRNSPIPVSRNREAAANDDDSVKGLPQIKRVSFRSSLCEEIPRISSYDFACEISSEAEQEDTMRRYGRTGQRRVRTIPESEAHGDVDANRSPLTPFDRLPPKRRWRWTLDLASSDDEE